jgi:hypothetical protein
VTVLERGSVADVDDERFTLFDQIPGLGYGNAFEWHQNSNSTFIGVEWHDSGFRISWAPRVAILS